MLKKNGDLSTKCVQERRCRSRSREKSLLWKEYFGSAPNLFHPGPSKHSSLLWPWEVLARKRLQMNIEAPVIITATAELVMDQCTAEIDKDYLIFTIHWLHWCYDYLIYIELFDLKVIWYTLVTLIIWLFDLHWGSENRIYSIIILRARVNPTDIEAGFVNVQNVLPSVTKHLRLLLYWIWPR